MNPITKHSVVRLTPLRSRESVVKMPALVLSSNTQGLRRIDHQPIEARPTLRRPIRPQIQPIDTERIRFPRQHHFKFRSRGVLSALLISLLLLNPFYVAYAEEVAVVVESAPAPAPVPVPVEVVSVPVVDIPVDSVSTPDVNTPSEAVVETVSSNEATSVIEVSDSILPESIVESSEAIPEVISSVVDQATVGTTGSGTATVVQPPTPTSTPTVSTATSSTPIVIATTTTPVIATTTTQGAESVATSSAGSINTTTSGQQSGGSSTGAVNATSTIVSTSTAVTTDIQQSESSISGGANTTTSNDTNIADSQVTTSVEPSVPQDVLIELTSTTSEDVRIEMMRQELRKQVQEEFLSRCVSLENSGYYCLKESDSVEQNKIVDMSQKNDTSVEAAIGEGGDREIFVTKNGARRVLTSNDWDDAFPAQDISGNQFVWQGIKNGRWQIFAGTMPDSGAPVVSQVTDSLDSNFNPKIDGNHLVWQGWVDNNWEIFIATRRDNVLPSNGEHLQSGNALLNVGPEWAVERLTSNSEPDSFPSLHGDIVTWQSFENNNWSVYAYSISGKTKTKLSTDGMKSESPRFALTWEEHDLDGHSRLMSYDIATGKKIDLTKESQKSSSNPFPENVPVPISDPNQAALPLGIGTSTLIRTEEGPGDSGTTTPPQVE